MAQLPVRMYRSAQDSLLPYFCLIGDPIGTGGMPGHADHEGAVMTVVGGPPLLGVLEQGGDVLLQRSQIQFLEFGGVVEVFAHRV